MMHGLRPPRDWLGRVPRGLLALALGALALLVLQNVALNLALPPLLNGHPDRLRVDYSSAWMWVPGRLLLFDLKIHNEGAGDRWTVSADRASAVIELSELLERHLQATGVRGTGLAIAYERRPDRTPAEIAAARLPNPWFITLDGLQLDDVRELRIGDYLFEGHAAIAGDVSVRERCVDADVTLSTSAMRADLGGNSVAEAISGEVTVVLEAMDLGDPDPKDLSALNGQAKVSAEVQNLKFLDFYLAAVPWLALRGVGHLEANFAVDRGQFRTGSELSVDFPELVVRLVDANVTGAGRLLAQVGADESEIPESRIGVDFEQFRITSDASDDALVEGSGFHVLARSPDVALDEPFSAVGVVAELPESTVPDLTRFNAFLPPPLGLSLLEGVGSVRGQLVATTVENRASGDLYLTADDVRLQFDGLAITADADVHALLADARLGVGWYDFTGTTAELLHVGIIDEVNRSDDDRDRSWWASVAMQSGVLTVGEPIYLDTTVRLAAANSEPFIMVFTERNALPGWVQAVLSVEDVSGGARVQLGTETVAVSACEVHGGSFQLDLRLLRDGPSREGDLLIQAGPLAVGVALRSGESSIKVFGAKSWFDDPITSGRIDVAAGPF